jgi:hypothetical protein
MIKGIMSEDSSPNDRASVELCVHTMLYTQRLLFSHNHDSHLVMLLFYSGEKFFFF